eukprot:TRINITY_DN9965_c0_g2_i1.p1 TRINITY_DN9965_c0_g2~~TRINITY_DN9965_c0_g2_i1.p1  ORF type:complete len:867 (+),score=151.98 TRINITY_DN9965_c0_g2_i1:209-2809(+)
MEIQGAKSQPLKHQEAAIEFLTSKTADESRGAILADGMGLGKTFSILMYFLLRRQQPGHENRQLLVVCPKSVMRTWLKEVQTHTNLSAQIYEGGRRNLFQTSNIDVIICNYDLLSRDVQTQAESGDMQCTALIKLKPEEREMARFLLPAKKRAKYDLDPKKFNDWILRRQGKDIRFDTVVLDEAHKARSSHTNCFKALQILCGSAAKVICATGTPIHNKTADIVSLCMLIGRAPYCNPEWFEGIESNQGKLEVFRKEMLIARGKEVLNLPKIKCAVKMFDLSDGERTLYNAMTEKLESAGKAYATSVDKLAAMRNMLTWLLRVRQSVCHSALLLGSRTQTARYSKLSKCKVKPTCCICDNQKYLNGNDEEQPASADSDSEMADSDHETENSEDEDEDGGLLSALKRKGKKAYKQLACGDLLCQDKKCKKLYEEGGCIICKLKSEWLPNDDWKSSRVMAAVKHVKECIATGDKIVVFSQWTSFLDLLEAGLSDAGIVHLRFDGSMSSTKQNEVLETFRQQADIPVILISLHAGGVGINLTVANHVLLCDPWYNPMIEDQARDRVHRIGQTKETTVTWLAAESSIDIPIMDLQAKKRQVARDVIIGKAKGADSSLSSRQVLSLIGTLVKEKQKLEEKKLKQAEQEAKKRKAAEMAISEEENKRKGVELAARAAEIRRQNIAAMQAVAEAKQREAAEMVITEDEAERRRKVAHLELLKAAMNRQDIEAMEVDAEEKKRKAAEMAFIVPDYDEAPVAKRAAIESSVPAQQSASPPIQHRQALLQDLRRLQPTKPPVPNPARTYQPTSQPPPRPMVPLKPVHSHAISVFQPEIRKDLCEPFVKSKIAPIDALTTLERQALLRFINERKPHA